MANHSYDQESTSSSSTTIQDSIHSWMSPSLTPNLSLNHQTNSSKPHKANQAAWEAMRGLRRQVADGRIGLDHFRILKRVGGGDIGNVYLCKIRNPAIGAPTCFYAMKVVDREALAIKKKLGRANVEKEILGMIDHPFLPTLYAEFEASHYSCLVMEFCPGGDLFALRVRQPSRRFHISSTKFYGAETLLALEYLHMMGIIYRDLKPENVLVRDDGHIMLSDFDLSLKCDVVPILLNQKNLNTCSNIEKYNNNNNAHTSNCFSPRSWRRRSSRVATTTTIRQGADGNPIDTHDKDEDEDETELVAEPTTARSKSFVGTHEYLAPEVLSGLGHGSAVDWWTFGVFLYEMLYGTTPFKGENNKETLLNILKQPVIFPRITLGSAKEYIEMEKVQDLICKLLEKNPKKRIGSIKGSNEIKKHEFFKGVNWALIRSIRPPLVPKEIHNNNNLLRINNMPKALSKKEREEPFQIPNQHFDYF